MSTRNRRQLLLHVISSFVGLLFVSALGNATSAQTTVTPMSPDTEISCGCRNVPGGYPCESTCPKCMTAVDCQNQCGAEGRWSDMRPMPFDAYGPGGYAGPARFAHLSTYRLRPGDQLQIIYLLTRRQETGEYRLMPGDEILIESVADEDLTRGTLERGLPIQPDGTITVRLLGQVQAAGLSAKQLRDVLELKYKKLYDEPSIDVTPVKFNTLAEDIRNAIGGQSGLQQQALNVTVMPDGIIRLPKIGGICVQGFSLAELKREINLRYAEIPVGLEVEPSLTQQADHFVHVLGQVATPNRIQLNGPTTVLGAIAQAGGHLPAGNMRQVVIFRRAEDWRLVSTMLDLQGAVFGNARIRRMKSGSKTAMWSSCPTDPLLDLTTGSTKCLHRGSTASFLSSLTRASRERANTVRNSIVGPWPTDYFPKRDRLIRLAASAGSDA